MNLFSNVQASDLTGAINQAFNQLSLGGIAGGIASTVASIPFAQAIPLTQAFAQYMPQQTVNASLAFTVAPNPVLGSSVCLRLIADGVNPPTFTGMSAYSGSVSYDNTANRLNVVEFIYDGYQTYYNISQEIYIAPPVLTTGLNLTGSTLGTINTASTNFTVNVTPSGSTLSGSVIITPVSTVAGTFSPATLTFNPGTTTGTFTYTPTASGTAAVSVSNSAGLTNPTAISYAVTAAPVYNAITLTGPTSGNVNTASSNFTATLSPANGTAPASTIVTPTTSTGAFTPTTLTLTTGAPNGTFTYTPTAAGSTTIALTNNQGLANPSAITYASSAVAIYPRFDTLRTTVESGTGPYTYTATSGGFGGLEAIAKSQLSFQNGVDGSIVVKIAVAPQGDNATSVWGVAFPTSTVNSYSDLPYALWDRGGGYNVFGAGSATVAITPALGDYMRLKRTGSNMTWSVSKDNGATYTDISTYTGVPTTALSIYLLSLTNAALTPISSTGLA